MVYSLFDILKISTCLIFGDLKAFELNEIRRRTKLWNTIYIFFLLSIPCTRTLYVFFPILTQIDNIHGIFSFVSKLYHSNFLNIGPKTFFYNKIVQNVGKIKLYVTFTTFFNQLFFDCHYLTRVNENGFFL